MGPRRGQVLGWRARVLQAGQYSDERLATCDVVAHSSTSKARHILDQPQAASSTVVVRTQGKGYRIVFRGIEVIEAFVIVYNEGNSRTSYVKEVEYGALNNEAITVPTVTQATLYDTWDEAMDKILLLRDYIIDIVPGAEVPMMFPMSVNKKKLFLAKLKYGE